MTALRDFYDIHPETRDVILLDSIRERHAWHYSCNEAYRTTVSARGVGPVLIPEHMPRVLRVSAITFKGYIERLGTSFPQDQPQRFLEWLAGQLSIALPLDRAAALRPRYASLGSLLDAIESLYADLGLEIVTSSGTSGKFTILVRDGPTLQTATDAYFTGIERAWGINAEHILVMVMPEQTRVAMAHIAHLGTRVLEWDKVEYTMPFKADPDTIRVRTGRTFRPGLKGAWERRVLNPFMAWADRALAERGFVGCTAQALERSAATDRPVMLLGGLVQLDAVAEHLLGALPRDRAVRALDLRGLRGHGLRAVRASACVGGAARRLRRAEGPPGDRGGAGSGVRARAAPEPGDGRLGLRAVR